MSDVFGEYAAADAILWLGERWTVTDAGPDVSDVDGRHLLLSHDGRTHAIHERLITRWANHHGDVFRPVTGDGEGF